jgi:hypothetical protein
MDKVHTLIGIVILVVIAAVLFPLVNAQVQDLTDVNSTNYVGASTAPIVGLVTIFYWLMVSLVVIGAAIVGLKGTSDGL